MRLKGKKRFGQKVVRVGFKGMVMGAACLFLVSGLPNNSGASSYADAVKAEAKKSVTDTVSEAKSGAEKTVVKAVESAKEKAKEAVVKPVSETQDKIEKKTEEVTGKTEEVKEEVKKDVVKVKEQVPEFIDINTQEACPDLEGLKKDKKSVKHFSHASHIKMLKQETKGFVCATCHKGAKSEDDILKSDKCKRMEVELKEAGGPAKLKDYFHSTCLKCHKELKKQGKATGPVSCKGCHSRQGGDE